MTKKILCAVLALILLVSVLAACGGGDGNDTGTKTDGTTASGSDTSVETEELSDEVPDGLKYDGRTFMIAAPWPSGQYVFIQEEDNTDPVDSAVWRRNKQLEARFDIVIDGVELGETGHQADAFAPYYEAGDDVIDLMGIAFYQSGASMIMNGYAVPWNDTEYIKLNKPWWDKQLTETMAILDNYYFLSGAFNYNRMQVTMAMFFNKKVAEDNKALVGDLYKTVDDGKWTQELLMSYVRAYSHDNGDLTFDENDYYGLIQNTNTLSSYVYGANILTATCDDTGFTYDCMTEKMDNVVEYARELINDPSLCYAAEGTQDSHKIFFNNHALFMQSDLALVESWRGYDSDFGILPLPKYDEAQDNYYTYSDQWGLGLMLPATVSDTGRVSAVLEAGSKLSYDLVVPAYYDVQLTTKLTRDVESGRMLDLIFSNYVYDPGIIYAGDLALIPMNACIKNDQSLSTWVGANQRIININLTSLFDYVKNNK